MTAVDATCPHCAGELWVTVTVEPAEERPKDPEPYILGREVEDFICAAIDTCKLSYSETGKLLAVLRIEPEPGKSWHAHTVRALHRRILEQRLEEWCSRQKHGS